MSVYNPEAKRRKTEVEREAEKAKKAERDASAASVDPAAEWIISQRQPWAEKQVQPARPTEEQLAWLKEEGFIKEEEEGEKVCLCSKHTLFVSSQQRGLGTEQAGIIQSWRSSANMHQRCRR